MRSRSKNRAQTQGATTRDERFDQAILWITLAALFLLPLLFAYFDVLSTFNELKLVTLHLSAGLIAGLWLWQIVLSRLDSRSAENNALQWDLLNWAGRNPARWALIGAAVWVFAQIASTLLSPLPIISFFGGDEARSGYGLYDSLSLLVIFASVALRFRTRRTLELLAYTLVTTGTIAAAYGIAQHFGWDPIGNNAGRTRVIASFGNTLNFGGYMVMSIPATLALVYKRFDRKWIWLAVIVGALSLQIAGIWFSGGRGPFVAGAASMISFVLMALAIGSVRETAKTVAAFAVASIIASIIIALPSEQGDIGLARVVSIGDQFGSNTVSTDIEGGLAGRFSIWGSTLQLATSWNMPIEEPTANSLLRPLFGVGQDLFIYSFPFTEKPQSTLSLVDHAHNYELQLLIEQGFVGFLGFMSMAGLLGIAVIAITRRVRKANRGIDATAVIMLALLPAMIGKMFELQTGVARVSDLGMTLALFGATIAIYELINRQLQKDESTPQAEKTASPTSSVALSASNQSVLGFTLLAAVLVTAVVLVIFVSWDVRRTAASRILAVGHDAPTLEGRAKAWADAQAQAPERESFTFNLAERYLDSAVEQHNLGNVNEALRQLTVGREMLLAYERRDPFELDTQIGLSKSTSILASWGHVEYMQELADRAINIAETYPAYPTLVGTSATAMASVELNELAIMYADRAIAVEESTKPWSKAWYAKGRALYQLGQEDEGIEALITATEKQPGTEAALFAHQLLAEIYLDRGQDELYQQHKISGDAEITTGE
jgi:tetratricopeptide (TPR) repeat protein